MTRHTVYIKYLYPSWGFTLALVASNRVRIVVWAKGVESINLVGFLFCLLDISDFCYCPDSREVAFSREEFQSPRVVFFHCLAVELSSVVFRRPVFVRGIIAFVEIHEWNIDFAISDSYLGCLPGYMSDASRLVPAQLFAMGSVFFTDRSRFRCNNALLDCISMR